MKFPIEQNDVSVSVFTPRNLPLVAIKPDENGTAVAASKEEPLTVCGWCVPKSQQVQLKAAGFILTHGICAHCLDRQTRKEQAHYEQAQ